MSSAAGSLLTDDVPTPPSREVGAHLEPLVNALARRAMLDEPAFTHVDYSSKRARAVQTLTWAGLYKRVAMVAATIAACTDTSARVAVLCPQDLTYPVAFFGALASGSVAVPLFAPQAASHADRLTGALVDCQASVWLTTTAALDAVSRLLGDREIRRPERVIAVDAEDLDHGAAETYEMPATDLDAIAYLQYTSGSTRAPVGAVISHAAVAANAQQNAKAFGLDERSTCVGWIPVFHDMGLMLLLCIPAALGAQSVFSAPFDFLRNPRGWLEELATHKNVITAAPDSAFDYAVDGVGPEHRPGLDLSSVRVAIDGGEPVRARTLERFRDAFEPHGFSPRAHRPSYGLAEATVLVSTGDGTGPKVSRLSRDELAFGLAVPARDDVDAVELVSAGKPAGQRVCIVHPAEHTRLPDDRVGEIWVHGPNLATSYWRRSEQSQAAFNSSIVGEVDGMPSAGWLRTGDLGVYYEGELYITGRLTDLIVVDGKGYYPQDIEETVQHAHPAVRSGRVAAFGVPTEAGQEIVVVTERTRGSGAEGSAAAEVARAIHRAVAAAHDLRLRDVQILEHAKVLRTSSGKIARAANRDRYLADAVPGSSTETTE